MNQDKADVAAAIAGFLKELAKQADEADLRFLAYLIRMADEEARMIAGFTGQPQRFAN